MSEVNFCRLCIKICSKYKRLYNDEEVYKITLKYYDLTFLKRKNMEALCYDCWCHILKFYNFQQKVELAQIKHDKVRRQGNLVWPTKAKDIASTLSESDNIGIMYEPLEYEEVDIKHEQPVEFMLSAIQCESVENSLDNSAIAECAESFLENVLIDDEISQMENSLDNSLTRIEGPVTLVCKATAVTEDQGRMGEKLSTSVLGNVLVDDGITLQELCMEDSAVETPTFVTDKTPPMNFYRKQSYDEQIAKLKPILECDICSKAVSNFSLLQCHYRNAHPSEEFYVKCCDKKFKTRPCLEQHLRQHIKLPYTCEACGKKFKWKSSLPYHKRKCLGSTKIGVKYMGNNSNSYKKSLDDRIAKVRPNLVCEFCSKSFATFTLLQRHCRDLHPKEAYYVVCCNRKFNKRSIFEDHLQVHSSDTCERCGKSFQNLLAFRHHRQTCNMPSNTGGNISAGNEITEPEQMLRFEKHTKLPYTCEVCGKKFKLKSSLPYHMRKCIPSTKIGVKYVGNNSASYKKSLDDRIAKVKPQLECSFCSQAFSTFTLLQCHCRDVHHNDDFYVMCCNRKFMKRSIFDDHLQLHNMYTCDRCGTFFRNQNSLRYHMTNCNKQNITDANEIITAELSATTECSLDNESNASNDGENITDANEIATAELSATTECSLDNESNAVNDGENITDANEIATAELSATTECSLDNESNAGNDGENITDANEIATAELSATTECSLDNDITLSELSVVEDKAVEPLLDNSSITNPDSLVDPESSSDQMIPSTSSFSASNEAFEKKISWKNSYDEQIVQLKPQLHCEICSEAFSTFTLLRNHWRYSHPKDEFYIMCCSQKFSLRPRLEEHLRQHTNVPYTCEKCGKLFQKRRPLMNHLQKCIPSNRQHKRNMLTSKDLDDRIAKIKPCLECSICSKPFGTFSLLHDHWRDEHPNEDFYIMCCNRKITERSRLEEHLRLHLKKPYVCERCGMCFKWMRDFTKHKSDSCRTYIKPVPNGKYKCTVCDERYASIETLCLHIAIHEGVTDYKCSHCPRTFAYTTGLRKHMEKNHNYEDDSNDGEPKED